MRKRLIYMQHAANALANDVDNMQYASNQQLFPVSGDFIPS